MPTEFRRYRDQLGHEFSSAVSPELAKSKNWTDVTSESNPATTSDGRAIAAKPAAWDKVAKAATKPTAPSTGTDTNKGA